jgi:hypothetical protein
LRLYGPNILLLRRGTSAYERYSAWDSYGTVHPCPPPVCDVPPLECVAHRSCGASDHINAVGSQSIING